LERTAIPDLLRSGGDRQRSNLSPGEELTGVSANFRSDTGEKRG
jgi:hypothetical protein